LRRDRVVVLFVRIGARHREASLAVGTAVAFAGRLGSSDGAALDQVSPASGCGGVGLGEGPGDAQAAEITSDERVRTRAPSVFFMATPLFKIEPRPIRGSGRNTPLRPLGLRPPGLLRNRSDSRRAGKGHVRVLKTRLRSETDEIHSSPAGEFLAERGMSPLQYVRRFAVTKMHDMAHPHGLCSGWCPDVVERAVTDAASAGFRRGTQDTTSEAALNRSDALLLKMNEVGILKVFGRYREQVDVEIGNASASGARWWSRRLVQLYEGAGLVRLDK
jgi:hypothetical protein